MMAEMGLPGRIVRVMLACPGDIQDELKIFFEEVNDWNNNHSEEYRIALLPKHWSTHSHPRLDGRPQGVINNQIVNKADFLIAIIGNKLGSPTSIAESGTVEEILEFYNTGRPVKLYFAEIANLKASQLKDPTVIEEIKRVEEFKLQARNMGIYYAYDNLKDFRRKLSIHLMQEVRQIRDDFSIVPAVENATQNVQAMGHDSEILNSIKVMRRSIQKLQIEWLGEMNSRTARYDSGKQIMSRLFSVLSTHLPELKEGLSEEKISPIESAIPNIMAIRHAHPVMGAEFHKEFWSTGTEVFDNLIICTKDLSLD